MDWHTLLVFCALSGLTSADHSHSPGVSHSAALQSAPSYTNGKSPSGTGFNCQVGCSTTVNTQKQLHNISSCKTLCGNVALTGALSQSIDIMFQHINGSFTIDGSSVTGDSVNITADNLYTVTGGILYKNFKNLVIPSFPALQTAISISFENNAFVPQGDRISWDAGTNAPNLQSVSVTFSGTNINVLGPFNPGTPVQYLQVKGNPDLTEIDLNSTESVGNVVITNNVKLTSLDLTMLSSITTMSVTQNIALSNISMPSLNFVQTALYLEGPLTKYIISCRTILISTANSSISVTFGDIPSVHGNITVDSSARLDCDTIKNIITFNSSDSSSMSQQYAKCISDSSASTTTSSGPPTPSSPSPHSSHSAINPPSSQSSHAHVHTGLSSGATVGLGVGVGVGGALALGFVLFLCWRKRSKRAQAERNVPKEHSGYSGKGNYYTYREVPYGGQGVGAKMQASGVPHGEKHTASSPQAMGAGRVPPEPTTAMTEGRTELEEQQGQRHEMDARSIDLGDIDDDGAETRSLEDIERVHRQ